MMRLAVDAEKVRSGGRVHITRQRRGHVVGSAGLVAQPRQAFRLAEHHQDVENAGRGGAAGQCRPQRLRDGAELGALRSAKVRTPARCLGRPGLDSAERGRDFAQQSFRLRGQQGLRFVIQPDRPVGEEKSCAVDEIDERLGALLQARHGRQQLLAQMRRQLRGEVGAVGEMRQQLLDGGEQVGIGACAGYSGR